MNENEIVALQVEARNRALEDAALLIEGYPIYHGDHYGGWSGPSDDAKELARAIRALMNERSKP